MKDLKTDSAGQLKIKETIVVSEEPGEEIVASAVSAESAQEDNAEIVEAPSKSFPEPAPDLGTRYDVLDYVGAGGMGTVWKVYDKELKETFAIKVLKPELLSDDVSLKRFQQEARLATDLTHANIAAIFGPGEDTKGRPYIIMRYVEGESLAQLIERTGPMDPDRAMELFWQINDALAHSHLKGITHRDIKPSNIIISRTESGGEIAQLVDFGISSSIHEKLGRDHTLTQTGSVLGSPRYMSPEQFLGQDVGPESDMYSLGCVLYDMLTGAPPFTDANPVKLIIQQINQPPDLEYIPKKLKFIVSALLEKTPGRRNKAVHAVLLHAARGVSGIELGLYAKYYFAAIPLFLSFVTSMTFFVNARAGYLCLTASFIICLLLVVSINLLVKGQLLPSKAQLESIEAVEMSSIFGAAALLVFAIAHYVAMPFLLLALGMYPLAVFSISRIDMYPDAANFVGKANVGRANSKDEVEQNKVRQLYAVHRLHQALSFVCLSMIIIPFTFLLSPLLAYATDQAFMLTFLIPSIFFPALALSMSYSNLDRPRKDIFDRPFRAVLSVRGLVKGLRDILLTCIVLGSLVALTLPPDYFMAAKRLGLPMAKEDANVSERMLQTLSAPHSEMGDFVRLKEANVAIGKLINPDLSYKLCKQIAENPKNHDIRLKAYAYTNLAYLSRGEEERKFADAAVLLLQNTPLFQLEHPARSFIRSGLGGESCAMERLINIYNLPTDLPQLERIYHYLKISNDLQLEPFKDRSWENRFKAKIDFLKSTLLNNGNK